MFTSSAISALIRMSSEIHQRVVEQCHQIARDEKAERITEDIVLRAKTQLIFGSGTRKQKLENALRHCLGVFKDLKLEDWEPRAEELGLRRLPGKLRVALIDKVPKAKETVNEALMVPPNPIDDSDIVKLMALMLCKLNRATRNRILSDLAVDCANGITEPNAIILGEVERLVIALERPDWKKE